MASSAHRRCAEGGSARGFLTPPHLDRMSDPISRLNAALESRYRIERELGEGACGVVGIYGEVGGAGRLATAEMSGSKTRFIASVVSTRTLFFMPTSFSRYAPR